MNNLDRASIAQLHQKLDALTTEDTVSSAAAARRAAQSEAQRSMQEHITSSKVMEDAAAVNEALAQARLQRKEARERLERQLLAPQRSAATADVAALPTSSSSVGGSFTRARTLLERELGKSANNLLQSRPSSSTQSFADTTPAASAVGGRRLPPIAMHREALEDAAHCRHPTQLRPGTSPTVGHSSTPSAAEAAVGGVILRHDAFTEEYDNGGRTALSGTLPPPASSLASTRRALSLTSYGEQVLKPFVQKKVVLGSLVPELTSLHDQIRALEEESLRAARVAEQKCRADELRKQYRTSRPDGDQDDEDEQENNTRKDGDNKSEQLSVKQREMFLRQALERGKANQENLKALRAEAERHAADIVARNEAHIRQLEETRAAALVAERYEAEYQQMRSELRKAVLMEVEEHLAQEDDDDEENEELREIAQRGSIPSRGVKGAANVFSARGDQATAASLSQSEPASSDVSIAPSPVSNLSTELQPGHSQDDQGLPLAPLNAAAAPVIGTAGPLAERKRRAGSPDFLAYIAEFGFLLPFEKNSELETPEFLLTPSHPLFQLEQQQDTLDAPSAANGEVMDPLAISEDDCFRLLSEPNRSLNDLLSAVKHCDPLFSFCTHPRRCPPYEKRIQRLWDAKPETPTAPSVASVAAAPTGPKKQKESSAPKNAVLFKKHDEPEEVASGLLTLAPAASSQSPQDATTTMQQSSGTEAPSHGTKRSPVPLTITTVPKVSSTTATTRSPTSRQSPRAPITSLSPTGLSTPPMFLSPQARRPSTLTFASMQPPIDIEERPFLTSYPFSERGASTSAGPFGHKNIVTDALEELRDELHTLVAEGIRHRNSVMRSSMIRANSVTGSLASAGVDRESSLARRASLAGLPTPSGGPAPFLTPEWSQQYSSEGVGGGNAASLGASMTNTVSQEDTDTLLRTYGDSDTPRLQDALAGSQKGNNKHFGGGSYPPTSTSKPLSQPPVPPLLDSSHPLSKQPSGGGGGSSVPLPSTLPSPSSAPPPHFAAAVAPPPPPETLAPRVFRNPETGALDDIVAVAVHDGEMIPAGATGSLRPSFIDQTLFYAAKTQGGYTTDDGGDASFGGALQTEISGFMATSQSFFLAASSHPPHHQSFNSAAAPPTIVMGSSSSSSPHIVRVTEATGQRFVTADGVSIRLNDDERPLTNNNNNIAAEIEPLSREGTALPLPDETEAEQARRGASSSSSSPQRSSLLTVEQTVKRSIARRNLRKIAQNTTLFGGSSKPSTVDDYEEL